MKIFEIIGRNDFSPSPYSEASYSYLNRSARPEVERLRNMLEDWFLRYPVSHKSELLSMFQSTINSQHYAAFFELLLHELFYKLDCEVIIHPSIEDTSKSPDFLVKPSRQEPFIVESTLATYQSSEEVSEQARINTVYDVLNRRVDSNNFSLILEIKGVPQTQPPAKKLANFLNQKLANLDPDEMFLLYKNNGLDAMPQWDFLYEDWTIKFRPIPKKPEARGKSGSKPLGMFSFSSRFVDHRTPLKKSVLDKASKYGDLGMPFVIAVNAMEYIDEIDVMEALFGNEEFTYYLPEDKNSEPILSRMSRDPDGVWTSHSGPRNSRVSAILITRLLLPWSISDSTVCLYHNPWTILPYSSVLCQLPQAIPDEGKMVYSEGMTLSDILRITAF